MKGIGAVCIEGPKACGKTWASLNHSESSIMIGDPTEDYRNRRLVGLDVNRALIGDTPHLIDEWQEVPAIWDAVRYEVDKTHEKGRFILTGSSTPKKKKPIHSGAGRIAKIRMRTMSLYELGESDGSVSLMDLFNDELRSLIDRKITLEYLIDLTVRGGWPGNIGVDTDIVLDLNRMYMETCIEDAAGLDGKARDTNKLRMTLNSLARNECTLANINKIQNDVKEGTVSDKAISHYIELFDRLFLLNNQPPYHPDYRSATRVGKSPKRHLTDPALAIAALNLTPEKLLEDLRTFGFMFESMCERDLDIYAQSVNGKLYHYHDANDKEIDAVIELSDGRWGAFEIKLGANQIDNAAKNLIEIKHYIEKKGARPPTFLCVICGLTSVSYKREDGVYVVPITSLKGAELDITGKAQNELDLS